MKIRDRVKELRRVPAGELLPNPKNWRQHPEAQQNVMRGVLAELGLAGVALARETEEGLMLLDGHLRAEIVDANTPIPVVVLDLTPEEGDYLLATYDPLTGLAGVDADLLRDLVSGISTENPEVEGMLADLLAEAEALAKGKAEDPEEDEIPEPPKNPTSQPGDIWILGPHRLLCGDSGQADRVEALLAGRRPFMLVTDPPYGVNYDPSWRTEVDGEKHRALGKVENDDRADWAAVFALWEADVAYVWHDATESALVAGGLEACGYTVRSQIIWKKQHFGFSRGHYHWGHEPCFYAVHKRAQSARWCGDRTQSTILEIANRCAFGGQADDASTDHATQKPVACMFRPISNHGAPGDLVADPFLGSGTTIIAAEKAGRVCYGAELNPAYCDVIIERWENLTGGKATRETGGFDGAS